MYALIYKLIADLAFYFSFTFSIFMHYIRDTFVILLLFVPPIVYAGYSCIVFAGKKRVINYTGAFRLFIYLYTPVLAVMMLESTLRVYALPYSIPFAVVFLFCAVSLIRITKHEPAVQQQARFQLSNFVSLGLVFVAGGVLSSAFFLRIWRWVLVDIAYTAFLFISNGVLFLLERFLSLFPEIQPIVIEEEAEYAVEEGMEIGGAMQAEMSAVSVVVFAVLGVVAVLLLLFFVYRILSRSTRNTSDTNNISYYEKHMPASFALKRSTGASKGMRRIYKRFVRLCNKRGIAPVPRGTSSYYAENAASVFNLTDEAEELRELYLPIRYGNKPPNKKDVARARELLKRMK
jgi:hypothetical protein